MNRTKLKNYAPKARREFIQAVTDRALFYGITPDGIAPISKNGSVAIIQDRAFPKTVIEKRNRLVERIEMFGFEQTMEAIAYTWFNRFAAIRFMELNGYLDHGYRVLSHPEGRETPEILEYADRVELPGLKRDTIIELKLDASRESELYRRLLIGQCNALNRAMPFLFGQVDTESELLLPDNLLHTDSLIRKLVQDIDEADWKDVEIIGWLYQFYISEKKNAVIGKVVKTDDIPAATQLFTPNWIVKYMVQNTLGRKWLATYPNSTIRGAMDYYIEPAEQETAVIEQLKKITPESLNPEDITFLDPACGSGHILVEAYDLFRIIYQERGYRLRDIPELILRNNLYGLEIDDRAAQLTSLSLLMKARADDRRIFERDVQPRVISIQQTNDIDVNSVIRFLTGETRKKEVSPFAKDELFPESLQQPFLTAAPIKTDATLSDASKIAEFPWIYPALQSLIELFHDAKTYGSLITVSQEIKEQLPRIKSFLDTCDRTNMMVQVVLAKIEGFVTQAEYLSKQYDVVVANPPYMGSKGMNPLLKAFAKTHYKESKSDLCVMFIERGFGMIKDTIGMNAMVTMQSWMFLSSSESFRSHLIASKTIVTLAQLGPRAFSAISGEVVQTQACVLMNTFLPKWRPTFFRLVEGNEEDKKSALMAKQYSFCHSVQNDFKKIPGSPIAYWVSNSFRGAFEQGVRIENIAAVRQGLATADNDRFLKRWFEVETKRIGFCYESRADANKSKKKWFPYNKGGDFCRWYGNQDFVVDWENDGLGIRNFTDSDGSLRSRPQNMDHYFCESISWSKISSSFPAFRYYPKGFIFDVAGTSIFPRDNLLFETIIGFCNSKVTTEFLKTVSPTLNFEVGHIASLPILIDNILVPLKKIITRLIEIAKNDWNCYETSWEFSTHPLLQKCQNSLINTAYKNLRYQWVVMTQELKQLEEKNNSIFIKAYGLQNELAPDVLLSEISLNCNPHYRYGGDLTNEECEQRLSQDTVKELISYAVGCMMGRYSLDKPGLILASQGEGLEDYRRRVASGQGPLNTNHFTFLPDADGIVPITETDWFNEDGANRFFEFIAVAWPKKYLEENLEFIADSLDRRKNEQPRDTIRRYFLNGFFKDHLKTYKKRPIYWLFSSGKHKAFQCLVYLHRYHEGTLSRMRTEYVIPLQNKISSRIEQVTHELKNNESASSQSKLNKELGELRKQYNELIGFDEKLRHYADRRIQLDLDDGVKVNYEKFGDLLPDKL
jgi:type II restriction/modification system DNA methylase subunit YeeA